MILETLAADGKEGEVLVPAGRYAKMRNVWFPSDDPHLWKLECRCGYKNIELLDLNDTSVEEQRSEDDL